MSGSGPCRAAVGPFLRPAISIACLQASPAADVDAAPAPDAGDAGMSDDWVEDFVDRVGWRSCSGSVMSSCALTVLVDDRVLARPGIAFFVLMREIFLSQGTVGVRVGLCRFYV